MYIDSVACRGDEGEGPVTLPVELNWPVRIDQRARPDCESGGALPGLRYCAALYRAKSEINRHAGSLVILPFLTTRVRTGQRHPSNAGHKAT